MDLIALYPNNNGIDSAVTLWLNDLIDGSGPNIALAVQQLAAKPAGKRWLNLRLDRTIQLTPPSTHPNGRFDPDAVVSNGGIPTDTAILKALGPFVSQLYLAGVRNLDGIWFNNEQAGAALVQSMTKALALPAWAFGYPWSLDARVLHMQGLPSPALENMLLSASAYTMLNDYWRRSLAPLLGFGPCCNSPGGVMAGWQAWNTPDTFGNPVGTVPPITAGYTAPVCSFKCDDPQAYPPFTGWLRHLDALAAQTKALQTPWMVLTIGGMPGFGPWVSEKQLTANFEHASARGVKTTLIFNVPVDNGPPADVSIYARALAGARILPIAAPISPIDYNAGVVQSGPFSTSAVEFGMLAMT